MKGEKYMKNYIVYMHITPNNKKYIGVTCRKKEYRWRNGSGYKGQQLFYRAIQKYGWENIEHIILFENLTKEEAENKEIELIRQYKTNRREYGYNISLGGNLGTTGLHFSNETKEKMSINQKGKNNSFYGKHHTKEVINKIKKANTNRTKSFEEKEKIRKAKLGHIVTQETREKISEGHKGKEPWNKGKKTKPLTEEHKNKIRNSMIGKKFRQRTIEERKKTSKPVICIETNKLYYGINEASRQTKTNVNSIVACCKGKRKKAGNMHWKYYMEEL